MWTCGQPPTKAVFALWERLRSRCVLVEQTQTTRVCRDLKDDACLALCVAAGADILITGDQDLLIIDPRRTPGIPKEMKILTPRQFLDLVNP